MAIELNDDITGLAEIEKKHAEPIRFLVFSVSLRKDSYNSRLAQLAGEKLIESGCIVDFARMEDFDCISYDQDIEDKKIFPPGAEEFRKRIQANDALIISSPEYNGSMPGSIKNSIDWVSRYRPQPFNEKQVLLMSASPSMAGGNKALWSLRLPMEHLGARVYPNMFSLATAHKAFNEDGTLNNPELDKRFADNLIAFRSLTEAAKNYPCLKKAWIEFLGEKPDPVTDRIE
ncbi:MAG TPA: NAD(P)H-dependent oxidoreductase [Ignavibacteria bacterium]|nr:NAD(P)H-dependent oxidoreductase [Ignavibacteria bacterium]HMR41637.1 NAD(P)H-dependent oxidoreductase [Ignavibacteria bacterium]